MGRLFSCHPAKSAQIEGIAIGWLGSSFQPDLDNDGVGAGAAQVFRRFAVLHNGISQRAAALLQFGFKLCGVVRVIGRSHTDVENRVGLGDAEMGQHKGRQLLTADSGEGKVIGIDLSGTGIGHGLGRPFAGRLPIDGIVEFTEITAVGQQFQTSMVARRVAALCVKVQIDLRQPVIAHRGIFQRVHG